MNKYYSFHFVIVILLILMSCSERKPEKTGMEGKNMPRFKLLMTDSVTQLNTSLIPGGKPIAMCFFGTYCPYSRAEMEDILNHMGSMKDIEFYIFTTSSLSDLKAFCDHYHLGKYKNITVGIDYTGFFGNYFEARGVPYTAVYGKDKRLKEAFEGIVYSKQIREVAED